MSDTLNLRIKNKSDTKENWEKKENDFTPMKGEIIFYSDINAAKIGDGETLLGDLPFVIDRPLDSEEIRKAFNGE